MISLSNQMLILLAVAQYFAWLHSRQTVILAGKKFHEQRRKVMIMVLMGVFLRLAFDTYRTTPEVAAAVKPLLLTVAGYMSAALYLTIVVLCFVNIVICLFASRLPKEDFQRYEENI